MKLSRRKMLGTMVGGAAAAPTALQQVGSVVAGGLSPLMGTAYEANLNKVSVDSPQEYNLLEEIKQWEKQANGELTDWQKERLERDYSDEQAVYIEIEALKSISESHKHRMKNAYNKRRMKDAWVQEAKNRLISLLKEKARRGIFG